MGVMFDGLSGWADFGGLWWTFAAQRRRPPTMLPVAEVLVRLVASQEFPNLNLQLSVHTQ
jgi:hypothetical protein